MELSKFEEMLKLAMQLADAQGRYDARQNPILLTTESVLGPYVITGVEFQKNRIVLQLEPEF